MVEIVPESLGETRAITVYWLEKRAPIAPVESISADMATVLVGSFGSVAPESVHSMNSQCSWGWAVTLNSSPK